MDPNEPIAIVGVGCRYPGANNLDEFLNLDFYYDANPNTPSMTYVRRAALVDGYDERDNTFYYISTSETEQTDPQQRTFFDCVHMTMEDGSITKKQLNGTYSGVYIGDCDMGICGGVNSILYPEPLILLSRARMASMGLCQEFSDKADGYARGDGYSIIFIKPLSKALSDGDKIWATSVTGCNQYEHTASSSLKQIQLLEKIFSQHNIDPSAVQYIEAHGTGIPNEDPVEANALGQFFSKTIENDNDYTRNGSVKTNIAHLESAAESAEVIKVQFMMKHGKYAASLHAHNLNQPMNFENYGQRLIQEVSDWNEPRNGLRTGFMNNFGFGGVDSHVVIKQHKQEFPNINAEHQQEFVISVPAENHLTLENNLFRMLEVLSDESMSMGWLLYTSTQLRDHQLYHTLFFTASRDEMQTQIRNKINITSALHKRPLLVYVCCGAGTTCQGVCKEFLNKVFAAIVEENNCHFRPLTAWSVYEKLKDGDNASHIFLEYSMLTCQIDLSVVWKYWGINPETVREIAVSYVSGALSLEDAVDVIYHRSLSLSMEIGGGMKVVQNLEETSVEEMCCNWTKEKVIIVVFSSPASATVSGEAELTRARDHEHF